MLAVLSILCLSPNVGAAQATSSTGDAVAITKNKPVISEVLLDSANPPESIRQQLGDHQAYTKADYTLTWTSSHTLKSKKPIESEIEASIVVGELDATLNLAVTLYLPKDAPKKLRDHEAGHQRIAETVYDSADAEAHRIARSKLGRTYKGRGATLQLAEKAAADTAGAELLAEFLSAVRDPASKVHEIYDELTHHGLASVQEADAIRDAFKKVQPAKSSPKK